MDIKKRIELILQEAPELTWDKFKESIENTYHNHFPRSVCTIKFKDNADALSRNYKSQKDSKTIIELRCYLSDNIEPATYAKFSRNKLGGSDVFTIIFYIHLEKTVDNWQRIMPNKLVLDPKYTSFMIKSKDKQTTKYSSRDIQNFDFKLKKGSPKVILSTLNDYFKIIRTTLEDAIKNNKIDSDDLELINKHNIL